MLLAVQNETVITIMIIAGVCIIGVSGFINVLLSKKKELKNDREELLCEDVEELPIIFEDATVISKRTDIVYGKGVKNPTHRVAFFVTFSVNGMEKELEVPEETFTAVVKNESATLITRDGQFLDFGECDLKAD